MIYASQYLSPSHPVGATQRAIESPGAQWELLDGRPLSRATYPLLSALFPIHHWIGNTTTFGAIPALPFIQSTSYTTVAAAVSGTSAIQYKTRFGSWANATTPSVTLSALLIADGYVFGLNSAAAQGIVTTSRVPADDITSFPTVVAATGGPTSVVAGTSVGRLVYAANLTGGGSAGVVFAIPSASTNLIYFVQPGGSAYQSLNVGLTTTRQAACWTGTKLLTIVAATVTSGLLRVDNITSSSPGVLALASSDNIQLPELVASGQGNLASDQNGNVVLTGVPSGILASYDHGVTFTPITVTGVPPVDTWRVQYSNGYWFIPTAQGLLISQDARTWQLYAGTLQSFNVATGVTITDSGMTPYQIVGGTATGYTATVDAGSLALPYVPSYNQYPSTSYVAQEQVYIRVR